MIICDTNIWYHLGSGKIPAKSIVGKELICTHLTLNELNKSHNLISNYKAVQEAVKAIKVHSKGIIGANPFSYAIKQLIPTYTAIDNDNGVNLWNQIQKVLHLEVAIPADKIQEVEEIYLDMNASYQDSITLTNDVAARVKKKLKESNLKKERRAEDTTPKTREFISRYLDEYNQQYDDIKHRCQINSQLTSWNNLELFVQVLKDFFLEIELSTQKIKSNDWGDVWNMVYVGQNDLYWTDEKQWKRFISSNAKTKKFLFEQ